MQDIDVASVIDYIPVIATYCISEIGDRFVHLMALGLSSGITVRKLVLYDSFSFGSKINMPTLSVIDLKSYELARHIYIAVVCINTNE